MTSLPSKYSFTEREKFWKSFWEETGVYSWNKEVPRDETFVVDTPPPTVSGSLHVGHVFSYTHTDLVVRFQRMRGKNILYPMGWDDNGLPTERRVQNKFSIRCNPGLPYDPDWEPTEAPSGKKQKVEITEVSRKNFIEACAKVTAEDEAAFEHLWRHLGLSVDWKEQYATIDEHCRRISQRSFLDLVKKDLVYNDESPTMWDVDFKTALAQADLEDRVLPGAYHDIKFETSTGESFVISTTRPELLVSCIAVVAHPDDERYQKLFGANAITPLFEAEVPIMPSTHADPEKGSGIMMICTFGDVADVDWWKPSGLPIKQALGENGRFTPIDFSKAPFLSKSPERATKFYAELEGKTVKQVRKRVAELLAEDGSGVGGRGVALQGEPKTIEHPVKFYEKGERPIEFITTRQWFVKILDFKKELLLQGAKINWHPSHMRSRYDHWVEGLNQDWCISRQRYFGVPFPVWYPISEVGVTDYRNPIYASEDQLPVDPLSDVPPGFSESQRGEPGGFQGDPDVMDTWATSSLTPQIASYWGEDDTRHKNVFPMDIRPQSHEIIRTWAFYTIVKAWMHEGQVPWHNVVISGWILDPDRKKMSKSKGNVVTPNHLLEQYSADGVRYWAARARLGVDTAFDEKVFKNGQKLATKLFNASKFVLSNVVESGVTSSGINCSKITEELDRALVEKLRETIAQATSHFERFDYANALQVSEDAFWQFCDGYVELVKTRSYSDDAEGRQSALHTLDWALSVFLRLFAPAMPYITEEVWSWYFAAREAQPTIHRAPWPSLKEIDNVKAPAHASSLSFARDILAKVHFAKSKAQKTLKWPVESLTVECGSKDDLEAVKSILPDVCKAAKANLADVTLRVRDDIDAATGLEVAVGLASEMREDGN